MSDDTTAPGVNEWDLDLGDEVVRKTLHDRFGGGRQGGIEPSRASPNVFVFTDPKAGERYGYIFDGWAGDVFQYTGEGQRGDQRISDGNRSLLEHGLAGRSLRLFDGVRGTVTYMGEFEVDSNEPFFWAEAPDGEDIVRQVVVFRLRPVDGASAATTSTAEVSGPSTSATLVVEVPIEKQNVETFPVVVAEAAREGSRREQGLVLSYRDWLIKQGCEVGRFQFRPRDEAHSLYCDLYNKTRNQIVECKATGTRNEIRMAIGQLADYQRFVPEGASLAVLLETRPRPDLEDLLSSQGVTVIWRSGKAFEDNSNGQFV